MPLVAPQKVVAQVPQAAVVARKPVPQQDARVAHPAVLVPLANSVAINRANLAAAKEVLVVAKAVAGFPQVAVWVTHPVIPNLFRSSLDAPCLLLTILLTPS